MNFSFRTLVLLALAATATSTLVASPYLFTYFNEASGGRNNGARHLLHSNLDWGQGLLELEVALDSHSEWGPVGLFYSGSINPQTIGTRALPISSLEKEQLKGLSHVAISANYLFEADQKRSLQNERPHFQRLRQLREAQPVSKLDGSIYVFDLAATGLADNDEPVCQPRSLRNLTQVRKLPSQEYASGIKSISGLLHVLQIHGLGPTGFTKLGHPTSGNEALRILTDEAFGEAHLGQSMFIRTRNGLRYRLVGKTGGDGDWQGESHRDQCLSTFAALKLPLSTPITLKDGKATLQEVLDESIANFTFDQGEMNWTALAYAHYVAPQKAWTDRFGVTTSFSDLANYLLEREFKNQSCGGMHLLQAIVALKAADDRHGIFDRATRIRCRNFVKDAIDKLISRQRDDGTWRYDWFLDQPQSKPETPSTKIVINGHVLEFLIDFDGDIPTQTVVRATSALIDLLEEELPKEIDICPLTHAIRGVQQAAAHRSRSYELEQLFTESD